MNRIKAIAYLERKDKLEEKEYTEKEEKQIERVMNEGKIYGDPIVSFKE